MRLPVATYPLEPEITPTTMSNFVKVLLDSWNLNKVPLLYPPSKVVIPYKFPSEACITLPNGYDPLVFEKLYLTVNVPVVGSNSKRKPRAFVPPLEVVPYSFPLEASVKPPLGVGLPLEALRAKSTMVLTFPEEGSY